MAGKRKFKTGKSKKSKGLASKVAKVVKTIERRQTGVHRPICSSGMPRTFSVRMKYCDAYPVTLPPLGGLLVQQFRLNSLFDPDLTNLGHQPYYRDQLAQFYATYKVLSCQVNITITGEQGSNGLMCIFRADEGIGAPANITLEGERTGGIRKVSQRSDTLRFSKKYWINNILGLEYKEYANDETMRTAQGANPTQPCVLNCTMQQLNTLNPAAMVAFIDYTLTFFVVQSDLSPQAQS